ncbi:long-chain fatty acid--CoA ligase [Candidatus Woesearchaeota archaeon]|nr:long-chain fatty acid--CoA ligase [Candidatus Woesearchaeota archaeon]
MPDTLGAMFAKSAMKNLNNPALGFISDHNRIITRSYYGILCEVESIAYSLLENGISKGDRVAIISKNSPNWAKIDLANQIIGAVTVSLYPNAHPEEIEAILKDSESKILFYDSSLSEKIKNMNFNSLEKKVNIQEMYSFLTIGKKQKEEVTTSDISTLCYTSGTTGEPKGVMLTHANIMHNLEGLKETNPFTSEDVHLSFLPLSHIFERTVGHYYPLYCGANIVYSRGLEALKDDLLIVKPTVFIGVPKVFEKVYAKIMETAQNASGVKKKLFDKSISFGKEYASLVGEGKRVSPITYLEHKFFDKLVYSKIKQAFGGKLRIAITGSAPISREVIEFYDAVGIKLLEGYGLTETSPVISANTLKDRRVGSVGKMLPKVEVKISSIDGHVGEGEIIVKGPNITQGYWNKPQKTSEVLKDGWFHTGDLGRVDNDGFLYITGRIKDEFKLTNGKYVGAANLEKTINKIPQVLQSVVLPSANKEYVVALIVPNNSDNPELEKILKSEISNQCTGFASYERIRNFALIKEPFTEQNGLATPTQKVKRNEVAKKYASVIEKL